MVSFWYLPLICSRRFCKMSPLRLRGCNSLMAFDLKQNYLFGRVGHEYFGFYSGIRRAWIGGWGGFASLGVEIRVKRCLTG
jgi:hypothetical protein